MIKHGNLRSAYEIHSICDKISSMIQSIIESNKLNVLQGVFKITVEEKLKIKE